MGGDVIDLMVGKEDVLRKAGSGYEECTCFGVVEGHAPCGCPLIYCFQSAIHL